LAAGCTSANYNFAGSFLALKVWPKWQVRFGLMLAVLRSNRNICLMSAGGTVSKEWAPKIAGQGCVVIDNSSAWRYDSDVPLIVPEVNAEAIAGFAKRNIIANPNCSTAQLVVALKPLHDKAKIRRVIVATYQSVSGAGKEAMDELFSQTRAIFVSDSVTTKKFPKRIAFNVIPEIDVFMDARPAGGALTAPLDPIGMDEGRVGDSVPLPHELRAGPQGDRLRGFGRAAARRTGGGLLQLPGGGHGEAAVRPLLKLINDPSDQEVAGEPHRRRHAMMPPPLAAQLEDGHLREPHERLCDIDRPFFHVTDRAAFRCGSGERRRWTSLM
jgi:Semialdehyde dehydrogenase, dimerisation domain/Semialdehyde dehydrogenase, NAD binding domain